MSETTLPSPKKRDFLTTVMMIMFLVGGCLAAWPLIASLGPSGEQVDRSNDGIIDLSGLDAGERVLVVWERKPIIIAHRTPGEIAAARSVDVSNLPYKEHDEDRTLRAEWLVVSAIGDRLGFMVSGQKPNESRGDFGGWYESHYATHFDTSGRARKGFAKNLEVPRYKFIDESTLQLLPSDVAEIPKLNSSW